MGKPFARPSPFLLFSPPSAGEKAIYPSLGGMGARGVHPHSGEEAIYLEDIFYLRHTLRREHFRGARKSTRAIRI